MDKGIHLPKKLQLLHKNAATTFFQVLNEGFRNFQCFGTKTFMGMFKESLLYFNLRSEFLNRLVRGYYVIAFPKFRVIVW